MSDPVPRLHVDITSELHRRAKIVAARHDLTMKSLIIAAVERFVAEMEAADDNEHESPPHPGPRSPSLGRFG